MNKVSTRHSEIAERLEEGAQVKKAMAESMVVEIGQMVELIIAAYKAGGKVVLFGNGGSAFTFSLNCSIIPQEL